ANPVNLVVNGNTAVRAVFVPRFTVTVWVEGSGSVDPNGGTFDGGSQINLTATPSGQDVHFIEWQGDLTGPTTPPRQGTVRCVRRDVVSTSTAWASM
ncbi:MAG: hypothetical protein KJ060_07165, partial [Candidatus Hydrogenedentes bacterium]|nr:hypothetical protein [Candidatus Hydrogenedentota bacterium]